MTEVSSQSKASYYPTPTCQQTVHHAQPITTIASVLITCTAHVHVWQTLNKYMYISCRCYINRPVYYVMVTCFHVTKYRNYTVTISSHVTNSPLGICLSDRVQMIMIDLLPAEFGPRIVVPPWRPGNQILRSTQRPPCSPQTDWPPLYPWHLCTPQPPVLLHRETDRYNTP